VEVDWEHTSWLPHSKPEIENVIAGNISCFVDISVQLRSIGQGG